MGDLFFFKEMAEKSGEVFFVEEIFGGRCVKKKDLSQRCFPFSSVLGVISYYLLLEPEKNPLIRCGDLLMAEAHRDARLIGKLWDFQVPETTMSDCAGYFRTCCACTCKDYVCKHLLVCHFLDALQT